LGNGTQKAGFFGGECVSGLPAASSASFAGNLSSSPKTADSTAVFRPHKTKNPLEAGFLFYGGEWTRTTEDRSRGIYSQRQYNTPQQQLTHIYLKINQLLKTSTAYSRKILFKNDYCCPTSVPFSER